MGGDAVMGGRFELRGVGGWRGRSLAAAAASSARAQDGTASWRASLPRNGHRRLALAEGEVGANTGRRNALVGASSRSSWRPAPCARLGGVRPEHVAPMAEMLFGDLLVAPGLAQLGEAGRSGQRPSGPPWITRCADCEPLSLSAGYPGIAMSVFDACLPYNSGRRISRVAPEVFRRGSGYRRRWVRNLLERPPTVRRCCARPRGHRAQNGAEGRSFSSQPSTRRRSPSSWGGVLPGEDRASDHCRRRGRDEPDGENPRLDWAGRR